MDSIPGSHHQSCGREWNGWCFNDKLFYGGVSWLRFGLEVPMRRLLPKVSDMMIALDGFSFDVPIDLIPGGAPEGIGSEKKAASRVLDQIIAELLDFGYTIERARSWKQRVVSAKVRLSVGQIAMTMGWRMFPGHVVFRIEAFGGLYGQEAMDFPKLKDEWISLLAVLAQCISVID